MQFIPSTNRARLSSVLGWCLMACGLSLLALSIEGIGSTQAAIVTGNSGYKYETKYAVSSWLNLNVSTPSNAQCEYGTAFFGSCLNILSLGPAQWNITMTDIEKSKQIYQETWYLTKVNYTNNSSPTSQYNGTKSLTIPWDLQSGNNNNAVPISSYVLSNQSANHPVNYSLQTDLTFYGRNMNSVQEVGGPINYQMNPFFVALGNYGYIKVNSWGVQDAGTVMPSEWTVYGKVIE